MLAFHRPSYDWDGLYYHLPALNDWVVRGRVAWIDGSPDVPFVNYPMAVEAHAFLMHQVFRASSLVDALNLWYWPLAFTSVVVLAEGLGVRGPWRWLAGALLAGAPVFVSQSVTSYVDPGFGAAVMAALAASHLLVFSGRRGGGASLALLWGAGLGLVLGAKGSGVVLVPILVTAVVVVAARAQKGEHQDEALHARAWYTICP